MTSQAPEILAVLQGVLEEYAAQFRAIKIPHEGGERPFRKLLVDRLIEEHFGWPRDNVVVGERFDILCLDEQRKPVIAIETKTPGAQLTVQDYVDFESRLSYQPTIEHAYITDGWTWDRVDTSSPRGDFTVTRRVGRHLRAMHADQNRLFNDSDATKKFFLAGRAGFDLNKQGDGKSIHDFFAPLASRVYAEVLRTERNRIGVSSERPHLLQEFASTLTDIVGDLELFQTKLFFGFRSNRAGNTIGSVTRSIFDEWCRRTYVVPPSQVEERIRKDIGDATTTYANVVQLLQELGFASARVDKFVDQVIGRSRRIAYDKLDTCLWDLYQPEVSKLLIQTAHVLVARILLYRIGEDQEIFDRRLSGVALTQLVQVSLGRSQTQTPVLQVLADVRRDMESWLPSVYQLGEFDWWLVPDDKRSATGDEGRAWLDTIEHEFEVLLQRTLRQLDAFWFAQIDVDVWRYVYQYYLPPDDRQRLGGFYTPDELIDITLDLCGWTADRHELCRCTFMDPASGSGAFVVSGIARLLDHLGRRMDCHEDLFDRKLTDWQRAERKLRYVVEAVHAVDIHPFAAFLTTVNIAFMLLQMYVEVRRKKRSLPLDLHVFVADSLERPEDEVRSPDLFRDRNSRIQLQMDSHRRFLEIANQRYDFVFGNPPWGGILKGPLAPIFDEGKKRRFKINFPDTVSGKYDIYGLFMDRGLQMLKPGGKLGFVTQASFIDKEWAGPTFKTLNQSRIAAAISVARGLRRRLAEDSTLLALVDLNPFGQLFFKGMNIPCITVVENTPPSNGWFPVIMSSTPKDFADLSVTERRIRVKQTVESLLQRIMVGRVSEAREGFGHAFRFNRARLKSFKENRWILTPEPEGEVSREDWPRASDILEPYQGVTPGGEGGLEVFQMTRETADSFEFERELVHPVLKGRETLRWRIPDVDHVMLYPYRLDGIRARPAFAYGRGKSWRDALDFENPLDDREREVIREHGLSQDGLMALLEHRTALNLVKFPQTAAYLVQNYEFLSNRMFEKKNIRAQGKQWYEYHRPRSPEAILFMPKLVTPRLAKGVRFALDTEGIMPQDSCVVLLPSERTKVKYNEYKRALSKTMGKELSDEQVLKWCMAFLNSEQTQRRLVAGQRPTPMGFFSITGKLFIDIHIPTSPDKQTGKAILDLVDQLSVETNEEHASTLERRLQTLVDQVYKS